MKQTTTGLLVTMAAAVLGGSCFSVLHAPIPWLLGPMTAVLLASRQKRIVLRWPGQLRDAGMLLVGYSIGLSFTREAAVHIVYQLPSILLTTVTLLCFSALLALGISKWTGISYPTILTGSIPGGLSQMVALAEEIKGIDVTVVAFLQITRVVIILFSVPLLIFSPLFAGHASQSTAPLPLHNGATLGIGILFATACLIGAMLAVRVKLPTAFLTGPLFAAAILSIAGLQGPFLPAPLLNVSQLLIGTYVGLLLKPEQLQHKAKMLLLATISSLTLILFSLGLSLLVFHLYHVSAGTSFLSTAPGGMDQMGLIAHEIHADLSTVTSYQLFRLFFIYFAVPPLLRWGFRRYQRTKEAA
ncbi:AbrB family transcriptional regulator [Ectobacillus ponti]|uniref:AbrB family transcriptional regulator n=1 Tax=Ectobacillus ponti TaxID=2961894 RepID=A0AA41XEN3_9BACI|nr:AbrB family transcriptional regulator [Ectobacillus ponti]MCP8970696.1 AbrB family transcriptional regulator [Ectobacillus ponti]